MGNWVAMVWLAVCCCGCIPGDAHVDEEKDPHFQRGRNLVNGQDFKGAVQEFEKALDSNPRSAAAHFELGWLYEEKVGDFAAAIYHYQRYLELQPDSERSQAIDVPGRIRGCKQRLANTEFPLPNSQNLQREVDRLTAENMLLRQQLDVIRSQAAAHANIVPPRIETVTVAPTAAVVAPTSRVVQVQAPAAKPAEGHPRVHIVKGGETITSIAAQYGVKASAIEAANPQADPRRLRVGQSLNLP